MKKFLIGLMIAFVCNIPMSAKALTIVNKDMGFISVNASSSKEVVPDTASISFAVETFAPDSKTVVAKNKEITSKLILALKPILAVESSDSIQTKNFILKPNYITEKNGKKTFKNYSATNIVFVKTKKLENVSKLIDTAAENNVTNISELNFYIENEKQYTSELAREAINKAKIIANLTASELNQKVKGIKSIRVNIYPQNRYMSTYAASSNAIGAGAKSGTPIEFGKTKIQANVDAEFYVK